MYCTMTEDDLRKAADQLNRSTKGRNAMRRVLAWLDDDGIALDCHNQSAIVLLIEAAFTRYPGSARDVMRDCLGEES